MAAIHDDPRRVVELPDDGFGGAAAEDGDDTEVEVSSALDAATTGDPSGGPTSSAPQSTANAGVPATFSLGDRAERQADSLSTDRDHRRTHL